MHPRLALPTVLILTFASVMALHAQRGGRGGGPPGGPDPATEPFVGVTTNGTPQRGLFTIRRSGVSTEPVVDAAIRFLASLSEDQRRASTFAADDIEWRRWNNVHRAARTGVAFKDLSQAQNAHALALLQAGLSARGLDKARDVMRLNGTIAELTNNFTEYGDGLYYLVVLGEPSTTAPWGWQLEGHHLIVNYLVLGDQVVMTPTFMGSEPVIAESGRFAGTTVLQPEQDKGLAFMQALRADQQKTATIEAGPKPSNKAQSQAFRDNLTLPYAGLRATEMDASQRARLLGLIEEYVGNMDDGHARVRMEEVRAHLDDTRFAWIGETGADSVFYYRIHSPVILIEFDHQTPVALPGPRVPGRQHIHTVVRTPNGNDYGKDLLRQHYAEHAADPAHGHVRAAW
jgi:Protein of unknown function (DUF3500)